QDAGGSDPRNPCPALNTFGFDPLCRHLKGDTEKQEIPGSCDVDRAPSSSNGAPGVSSIEVPLEQAGKVMGWRVFCRIAGAFQVASPGEGTLGEATLISRATK